MLNSKKVSISNTEHFTIKSSFVNDSFSIRVALPKKYDINKKYPAIYLTDANIFFAMVSDIAWLLQFGKEIPEVIVVGIGYISEEHHLESRNRDLLPTNNGNLDSSGRAKEFLGFIEKELKPYIGKHYSIDPHDSTLAGDSYGGLFGLYVLFNSPTSFNRYIIGSPSIYWDNCIIFDHEKKYSEQNSDLTAKVFLSAGDLEAIYEPAFAGMLSNVVKLNETLTWRKYYGLDLVSHIFHNETHMSVIPGTMSRGLREVFK